MKKSIFFSLLALLCLLISLELYLRRSMPQINLRQLIRPSTIPGLVNELRPNIEFQFEGLYKKVPPATIKISSQGLRDREYSYQKPKDTNRVAILGDSIAFGWGVENEQCFAKILEKMLNASAKKFRYKVLNFSVPGYNFKQQLICLKEKVTKFDVDYILIYAINNDFEPPVADQRNLFWNLFEKSYIVRRVYFSIRTLTHNPAFMNYGYYSNGVNEALPLFESIIPILKSNNIKLIFAFHNIFRSDISALEELKHFLQDNSIPFLLIDDYINWSQQLQIKGDGHPNVDGHRAIAEAIFSFLKSIKII